MTKGTGGILHTESGASQSAKVTSVTKAVGLLKKKGGGKRTLAGTVKGKARPGRKGGGAD